MPFFRFCLVFLSSFDTRAVLIYQNLAEVKEYYSHSLCLYFRGFVQSNYPTSPRLFCLPGLPVSRRRIIRYSLNESASAEEIAKQSNLL